MLVVLSSLAVEAFADALEIIPLTLAENSGQLQPIATLRELRKAHAEGKKTAGLNVYTGDVVDMAAEKVVEPLKVVLRALGICYLHRFDASAHRQHHHRTRTR